MNQNIKTNNCHEICPDHQSLKILRTGYVEGLPFEQQCHGEEFRVHANIVMEKIAERALQAIKPSNQVDLALAWRAALPFGPIIKDAINQTQAHHINVWRNEETAKTEGEFSLPSLSESDLFVIADPMMATGNTMVEIMNGAVAKGFQGQFICMSVVAAPEGVAHVSEHFPAAKIYTGALDTHLDENFYICPGLGDFGDKYYHGIQGFPQKAIIYIDWYSEQVAMTSDQKQALLNRFTK